MDGVLNLNKPIGPTSHDVVAIVRRVFGQKRVGHIGTLDPMAEGVLVVCLGRATRLVQYMVGCDKEYRAVMALGSTTETQDATGKVTGQKDASGVTRESLLEAMGAFVGEIDQVPPMVSAIKRQGTPLYKLARQGREVERQPRRVTIQSLHLIDFRPGPNAEAEIVVTCSSGTYIRTLCADIGDRLGCGGHMKSLIRTRVGRFSIEDSVPLDVLRETPHDRLVERVIPAGEALADMPGVLLSEAEAKAAINGLVVESDTLEPGAGLVRMLCPDGSLVGVGMVCGDGSTKIVRPKTVLVGPEV